VRRSCDQQSPLSPKGYRTRNSVPHVPPAHRAQAVAAMHRSRHEPARTLKRLERLGYAVTLQSRAGWLSWDETSMCPA